MQNFEFIDLAENAIRSLEMISMEFSSGILKIGAISIMMNLIHFLIGTSQKHILTILNRTFRNFSDVTDYESKILPILPELRVFLSADHSNDALACDIFLGLSKRILRVLEKDPKTQEAMLNKAACNNGLVEYILDIGRRVLSEGQEDSPVILFNLLSLINKVVYMSIGITRELLFAGLQDFMLSYLDGLAARNQGDDSKAIINELIGIVNTLLSIPKSQSDLFAKLLGLTGIKLLEQNNPEGKLEVLQENKELISSLLITILRNAVEIYESNEDFFFKYIFLTSIRKILIFFTEKELKESIDYASFANFIARTLESKDLILILISLLIIESLKEKLPDLFSMLAREGIADLLALASDKEYLIECQLPDIPKPKKHEKEKAMIDHDLAKKLFSGTLNDKQDMDELMKQLLSWQNDPSLLLDNIRKMKEKEVAFNRLGNEEDQLERIDRDQDEEGEEEDNLHTNPDNLEDDDLLGESVDMQILQKEDLESSGLKDPTHDASVNKEALDEPTKIRKSLSSPDGLYGAQEIPPQPKIKTKAKKLEQESVTKEKKEYDILNARDEISALAISLKNELGANYSGKASQELELLIEAKSELQNGDVTGLQKLADIFKGEKTLTFFEFTHSGIVDQLVDYLVRDSSTLEDRGQRLGKYYSLFYKNNAESVTQFYESLKEYLTRIPEVMPFCTMDQVSLGSFVQELKYLSTPVRIKVSYSDDKTILTDCESFIHRMEPFEESLDIKTKSSLYEEAVKLLDDFCEMFKQNAVILFQVERFASLNSVEKYMMNKFAPKILSNSNFDFTSRKRKISSVSKKQISELDANESDAIIDSAEKEKILTKNYLERKMRDRVNWAKDKDFKKNLLKQFYSKPNKILKAQFYAKYPDPMDPTNTITEEVDSDTTIYELVLKHKTSHNATLSIELCFGLELKTDFLRFSKDINIPPSTIDSGFSTVFGGLKHDLLLLQEEIAKNKISKKLAAVLMAVALIAKLDEVKLIYLDGQASKLQQFVTVDDDAIGCLGERLHHEKLSAVYTRIFKEPLRILGRSYPRLVVPLFRHIPELFDFASRYNFFRHVQFKPTRAMYFVYQANKPAFKELPSSKIGKLRRKKLKVSRDKIVEGAEITFSFPHSLSNLLEFDFDSEEGSGLGPTLEFYSLLAEEFKKDSSLWRQTDDFSYFPAPTHKNKNKIDEYNIMLGKWRTLGAICGRSIIDLRVFDLQISDIFWKATLGKKCTLKDLGKINSHLQSILNDFQSIANIYSKKNQNLEADIDPELLSYNGVAVEDLCLAFTLPGYDTLELVPGGKSIEVNLKNLQQYIDSVIQVYLVDSIMPQVHQFREGLNSFLEIDKLMCMQPSELESVICGEDLMNWDLDYLKNNIMPSHGYGPGSKAFLLFLEVLVEMDENNKREFLKFAIGAPRLPLGGLAGLSPKLTVVKKIPINDFQDPNMLLPSVMTCQNYVKLPDYDSKKQLIDKLSFAIKEGQKSFSLS